MHLADAVLPDAQPGRRLRHHRLPRRRPAARRPRRRRRGDPPRDRPRAARARRPRRQPHLDPAPVVPGRPRRPRLAVPRLLRVERRPGEREGHDARQLDVRRRGRAATTCTASSRSSPTSTSPTPRSATQIAKTVGFWLAARRLGLPHGRRAVPVRGRSAPTRPAPATARRWLHALREYALRRRGDAMLMGEVNVDGGPARVLLRGPRRRAAPPARLPHQPAAVAVARPRRGRAARGPDPHAARSRRTTAAGRRSCATTTS